MSGWTAADMMRITAQPGYYIVGKPKYDPLIPHSERRLVLPFPPSVNHYLQRASGKPRHTAATRAYFAQVAALICPETDAGLPLTGTLSVTIDVYPPDLRRHDLDNLCKVPLDALQAAGLYQDDHQITALHLYRHAPVSPAHLVVTVAPASGR